MNRQEQREQIAKYAKEAFKNHVLTCEQDQGPVRMWYCGSPNAGFYGFRVIAAPGCITVYGDVGDNILMASDRDLIPWLKSSIRDHHYLISKIQNKTKLAFFADDAKALLKRLVEEAYDDKEKAKMQEASDAIMDEWEAYEDPTGDKFFEIAYSNGIDSEYFESVTDYDSNTYWTVECLRKFVELLECPGTKK